jgi:hypothetical protein
MVVSNHQAKKLAGRMTGHDVGIRFIKPNGFMGNTCDVNRTGCANNNDPPDQVL